MLVNNNKITLVPPTLYVRNNNYYCSTQSFDFNLIDNDTFAYLDRLDIILAPLFYFRNSKKKTKKKKGTGLIYAFDNVQL